MPRRVYNSPEHGSAQAFVIFPSFFYFLTVTSQFEEKCFGVMLKSLAFCRLAHLTFHLMAIYFFFLGGGLKLKRQNGHNTMQDKSKGVPFVCNLLSYQ